MNFRNRMLIFLLLVSLAFTLSCEKEDKTVYPHPPEDGFREIYQRNKADLEKLVAMAKEDVDKSGKWIRVHPTNQSTNISQARTDEYRAITSKLVSFQELKAKNTQSDITVEIVLYDSHKDIVTCTQGLYYSTDAIENSSVSLDAVDCGKFVRSKFGRQFNKIEGNWYVYLSGVDGSEPR